jgi:hypothetical protein
MRLKSRSSASASVRTSMVLPSPGTPSSKAWPQSRCGLACVGQHFEVGRIGGDVLAVTVHQVGLCPVVVVVFQRRLCLRHERLGLQAGIGLSQQRPDFGDALVIAKIGEKPQRLLQLATGSQHRRRDVGC